jgi:CBS domain-containing protein
MKFGKYLDSKARPEWRDQYMDYKALKDLIKEASDELASAGYGPDGAGNELSFSPRTTSLTVARAAGRRMARCVGRSQLMERGARERREEDKMTTTLKARDVMTRKVLSISPETPVRTLATFLIDHRISAVPVVGAGGVPLGIVSEGEDGCKLDVGRLQTFPLGALGTAAVRAAAPKSAARHPRPPPTPPPLNHG